MTTWTALPDGVGTVLTVAGDICVAGQSGRLRAWHGVEPLWLAEADGPNPARPTVLTDRVLWGPYAVDLGSGFLTEVEFARVPAGYAQTAHAWSADGSVAVVAGRRLGPGPTLPPAAAWLLQEGRRATLWSGADVPPQAVAADPPWLVVGHRDPDLYGLDGRWRRSLTGVASPVRLDVQAGRLLVVEAGQLSIWELAAGALLGRVAGGWTDACLTPDGENAIAVELTGTIRRLSVGAGLSGGVDVPADGPALAVATDGRSLLAAFAQLPGLRRCALALGAG